ncbi:MAG TPA: secondary thiamine-phosphate synthase enzyme YjbQ [Stenomitos sp.]
MFHTLTVPTHARETLVDITAPVQAAVAQAGVQEGLVVVMSPHTTAGITVNENSDPDVPRDMLHWLRTRIPQDGEFHHAEGNSDAHLKASLFGVSQVLPVHEGRVLLGTWQAIFLAEFDGPRTRRVHVQVLG